MGFLEKSMGFTFNGAVTGGSKHVPNSVPSNSDTPEPFDCNIESFSSIVINRSVSSSCSDRNRRPGHVSSLV